MPLTTKDLIDSANPNILPGELQKVKLGSILAGLIPTKNARTSLSSSAAQAHNKTSIILAVFTGGAGLTMIPAGESVDAGEVAVAYSAAGVPTLTFASAVTAYTVQEIVLPTGHGTTLAEVV